MATNIHNLNSYPFSQEDVYLLDANVWLFLYPPFTPPERDWERIKHYTVAYKKIKEAKSRLAIDVLVLSEYINRFVRLIWNAGFSDKYPKYKDFRRSDDSLNALKCAVSSTKRIISDCVRYDHPFSGTDISQVLADLENKGCDVNDGLLIDSCRKNNWKVVTDDGDFKCSDVHVITNNKMLSA